MKINTYHINCYDSVTDLCEIGSKYGTDKSPVFNNLSKNYYNQEYRHSYTPFYSILFSTLKNKTINFGEIGIAHNASIKMWREYGLSDNIIPSVELICNLLSKYDYKEVLTSGREKLWVNGQINKTMN